jgi:hypothetical protein
MRLSADGCLNDYPCTKQKTFLQPSRVLSFFNPNKVWLIKQKNTGDNLYVRFSDSTTLINNVEYYTLQSSIDSLFTSPKKMAFYRVANETIYALEGNKERPVFNYFIFPTEEWRDTITLDTTYFTTIGNELRTKQFIYSSNKDKSQKYIWYNDLGCPEDFLFDSFSPNSTLPIWQICKFWDNGILKYHHPDLVCNTSGYSAIHQELINIYPNPFDQIIKIECNIPNSKYNVLNLRGSVIASGDVNQILEINTVSWPSGMYFIKIMTDKGEILKTSKLVK